ncbi:hypothetical protein [Pseudomonas sp. S3_B08]
MDELQDSNIIVRHANLKSKCWVVRPGARYKFINNFLELGCIAMAHLDDVSPDEEVFEELREAEGEAIFTICNELAPNLTINVRGQVLSFIKEMAVGDVVFTLSGANIYPGVITSTPYVANEAFSGSERFIVRRTVTWGDPIERSKIPITLAKSFHAYQAVFSLGDNSKEIHHWLSAFFVSDGTYYSSLRVNQAGDLSHHSLKNLSEVMDRLQVLSLMIGSEETSFLGEGPVSLETLLGFMKLFDEKSLLVLTSQQVVMSPGDLWYGFKSNSIRSGVAFLVGLAMLFNQTIAFADENLEKVKNDVTPIVMQNLSAVKDNVDLDAVKKTLWVKPAGQNRSFVDQEPSSELFPEDGAPRYSTR